MLRNKLLKFKKAFTTKNIYVASNNIYKSHKLTFLKYKTDMPYVLSDRYLIPHDYGNSTELLGKTCSSLIFFLSKENTEKQQKKKV